MSLFNSLVRSRGASLLRHAHAERNADSGQVDDEAVTYVNAGGKRWSLMVVLGAPRTTREIETEDGRVEAYEVKRRIRDVQVFHGKEKGMLPQRVDLQGVFELPGTKQGAWEAWTVEDIGSAGPVMTMVTIGFHQEIARGRPGAR